MTVALAQAAAGQLRIALLDHGVRAVSLELQPGVAGSGWHTDRFVRGMGHHIASRPSQGPNPGLGVVKKGRPDLGGPLCNSYGGFDRIARIITMGWANHPGAGGPWSVPGWGTVPRDNGRPYIFGWEFEGGYEPYTDEMHDFMARCGAGTLDWLGNAPLECWGEHKEPWAPGRKVDRIGYTAASGRARIAAVRGKSAPAPTGDDDDMDAWNAAVLAETNKLTKDLHAMMGAFKGGGEAGVFRPFFVAAAAEAVKGGSVDVKKLAAELAPLVVQSTRSLSQADLDAIGKAVADENARRLAS